MGSTVTEFTTVKTTVGFPFDAANKSINLKSHEQGLSLLKRKVACKAGQGLT